MSRNAPLRAFLLLLAAAGCGSSGGDPFGGAPTPSTVANVQNGTMSVGTVVIMSDVVITAIGQDDHTLWVADNKTGATYNGIQVNRAAGDPALGAGFVVGAIVEVSGKILELTGAGNQSLTVIGGVPVVSFTAPPSGAPVPVTGVPLAQLAADEVPGGAANGEAYEGVLVTITNVKVTGAEDGNGTRDFTDGAVSFVSDDVIFADAHADNTCFASVTGIWSYQLTRQKWAILPLGASSLTTGGTCP